MDPTSRKTRAARRELSLLWTPLSAGLHVGLAALLVSSVTCEQRTTRIGSQELDIDLVEPALAPPLRQLGAKDRHAAGRSGRSAEQRRRCAAAASPLLASSRARRERRGAREAGAAHRAARRRGAATPRERRPSARPTRQRLPAVRRSPRPDETLPAPVAPSDEHRAQRAATALLEAMSRVGPAAAVAPLRVAAAVKQRIERRRRQHRERLAAARQQRVRVARRLKLLDAVAAGKAQIGRGRGRGGRPHVGLKFYLSGRRVHTSRVVRPPQPLRIPHTRCAVSRPGIPPATVRMLVDKRGTVTVAYIRKSSKRRAFDRCALRHARKMRFTPGESLSGEPLNVWIHLRVEPSLELANIGKASGSAVKRR